MITPQFSSSQNDFGISAVESVAILIFDIVFLFLIDFAIRSVYHIEATDNAMSNESCTLIICDMFL